PYNPRPSYPPTWPQQSVPSHCTEVAVEVLDGPLRPAGQPRERFLPRVWLLCEPWSPIRVSTPMAFSLTSAAFTEGSAVPPRYTCDGADVSPPLAWSDAPPGTASFALIADDPDAPAGTWVHWVLYNLPANATELPEGVKKQEQLPDGTLQGRNDFRKVGYNGPCPPPGKPHRYFFKLYALNAKLTLKAGATKNDVESAMKGHILAQTELMGKYGR